MDKFSGFSAGVPAGLRWALFFLIAFYMLGGSAVFSVALAVIGGIATSLVVDWWKSKDELLAQAAAPAEKTASAVTNPVKEAIARLGLKRPAAKDPSDLPVRRQSNFLGRHSHSQSGPRRLTSRRRR
jgi:hypothetical protein